MWFYLLFFGWGKLCTATVELELCFAVCKLPAINSSMHPPQPISPTSPIDSQIKVGNFVGGSVAAVAI